MAQSAPKASNNFFDPEAGMGKAPTSEASLDRYGFTMDDYTNCEGTSSSVAANNTTDDNATPTPTVDKATRLFAPSSTAPITTHRSRWGRAFYVLHLAFHLAWLHIHVRLFGQLYCTFIYGKWLHNNRKIVVIGDDVALGVGDWVTLGSQPGFQGRLNKIINKDVMSRIIGRGVLWTAFTAAKAGATSEDWVPVASMTNEQKIRFAAKNGAIDKSPSFANAMGSAASVDDEAGGANNKKGRGGKKSSTTTLPQSPNSSTSINTAGITPQDALALRGASLFDKAFNPNVGTHKDADIVIIALGSRDTKMTILETIQNLQKICAELTKLGKHAILTTIPTPPSAFSMNKEALTRFRDRNDAMTTMIAEMQEDLRKKIAAEQNGGSLIGYQGPTIRTPAAAIKAGEEEATRGLKNRRHVAFANDKVVMASSTTSTSYTSTTPTRSPQVALAHVAESLTKDHCYRFKGKAFNGQGYALATEVVLGMLNPMMRSIDGKRVLKGMD